MRSLLRGMPIPVSRIAKWSQTYLCWSCFGSSLDVLCATQFRAQSADDLVQTTEPSAQTVKPSDPLGAESKIVTAGHPRHAGGQSETSVTTSPRSVNLIALPVRLTRICRKRPESPTNASGTSERT